MYDIVMVVKFLVKVGGGWGYKLCIEEGQHNGEKGSWLDCLLEQYQERAVRTLLRQLIGQWSKTKHTHPSIHN